MPGQFYISTSIALVVLVVIIIILYRGVRTKKRQLCKKGEWTTLISNFGTGYPKIFEITFKTKSGEMITGKYLEQKYLWIFPMTPKEGELKPSMTFNRNWINGIYKLKIHPDMDIEVFIE